MRKLYNVGFTGTRNELPEAQAEALGQVLLDLDGDYGETHCMVFHGGDCVGADKLACIEASDLGWRLIGHVPINDDLRAHCKYDEERAPLTYFARNRAIVNESHVLVGCPRTMQEESGGTWYTINYARKNKKPLYIVWPDGTVTTENL
jgi:hypothetical protein